MSQESARDSYVVAVSGGVDSAVLLHILATRFGGGSAGRSVAAEGRLERDGQEVPMRSDRRPAAGPAIRLIVAHFDHGIRPDSAEDRRFVEGLARQYGLTFVAAEGHLGAKASEAAARDARYAFLRQVRQQTAARSIVTAHHEDDVLETAILNLLRGTGRKGSSSLRSTDEIYRPLLTTPKAHIYAYARRFGLAWREDSTNDDTDYLRNYVRLRLLPRFDEAARGRLRTLVRRAGAQNAEIDGLLAGQLRAQPASDRLEREWFIMLPHAVAREVMAAWLRSFGIAGFDRRLLERLTVAGKTLVAGKRADVNGDWVVLVRRDELVLVRR